jgi:hypothetical protein
VFQLAMRLAGILFLIPVKKLVRFVRREGGGEGKYRWEID